MIRAKSLRQLQSRMTNALDSLAGQVASGSLSPSLFVVQAHELLSLSHSRAAFLGSARAKRGGNLDVAIRVAARASEEQRRFLIGFAQDLAQGKYRPQAQGGKGAGQRKARFALYSLRLAGTGNEAWKETLTATDPTTEGLWLLGKRDMHCPDCRGQAGRGWTPLLAFPFMPGQGRTICFLRCGCSVMTREGLESYAL